MSIHEKGDESPLRELKRWRVDDGEDREVDSAILRILSPSKPLHPSELRKRLGELKIATGELSQKTVVAMLESLRTRGIIEKTVLAGPEGEPVLLGYRIKDEASRES